MRSAARMMPASTAPGHMTGTIPAGGDFRNAKNKTPYETAPDGNDVVLEEQMMKANRTASEYQLTANLYSKDLNMLRSVLRTTSV